jgi:hypothetical protein
MVSLSSKPKDGVIGLAAPCNALPRKPVIADTTQSVYVKAVRDFLKSYGIADPKVRITRILQIDLEGDGEDEVLINATNYFDQHDEAPMHAPKRGSYSIVMLRCGSGQSANPTRSRRALLESGCVQCSEYLQDCRSA